MKARSILYCFLFVVLLLPAFASGGAQALSTRPAGDDPGGSGPPALQTQAAAELPLAEPFLTGPSYDSGWLALGPGSVLTISHLLNTDPELLLVDLQGRRLGGSPHALSAGGADLGPAGARAGAYWFDLTRTTVKIQRRPEDTGWEQVRLRLWQLGDPAGYSSGWTALNAGETRQFTHNLGGSAADLVVSLVFRAPAPLGVNAAALGGMDEGALSPAPGSRVGAFWFDLQPATLQVQRLAEDVDAPEGTYAPEGAYAPEVLVRIWKRPTPTFDSGWLSIDPGQSLSIPHGIGGSPADMLVDVEYQSAEPGIGINQVYAGGNRIGSQPQFAALQPGDEAGARWSGLNSGAVVVERLAQDIFAGQVRVRVWNFWKPRLADFDSGWVALQPGEDQVLSHALGGDPQAYLADLQFKSGAYGVTQRGLGGMYNDQYDEIGGTWQELTAQSVTVERNPDDNILDAARLRLWVMPRPDYDSGWTDIDQGQTLTLAHNLGGSPEDYLVDVQFSSSEHGVHQIGYGGYDVIDYTSDDNGENRGAAWHSLTAASLQVTRQAEDEDVHRVRARLWRMALPDFKTWISQQPGELVAYPHNLGLPVERLFVNLEFKSSGSAGLNQLYYGGAFFGRHAPAGYTEGDSAGGYYKFFDNNTISIFRMMGDNSLDQAQIRMWAVPYLKTYLAVVK